MYWLLCRMYRKESDGVRADLSKQDVVRDQEEFFVIWWSEGPLLRFELQPGRSQ
jgi:hypothetical protein